jgi:hypothetical protein
MVISVVLLSHQPRRFVRFPRNRCVLSVGACPDLLGALDSFFSFLFFNFQPSNLQTFQRFASNSFPHNLLSDPHPLNPAVSIFYKKGGGGGRLLVPSLPLCFIGFLTLNQKGSTMSTKSVTTVDATIDHQCQHISPKGRRCNMLIDDNHRRANGAHHPMLCAYHADRLRATVPPVDPEVLAAELLGDIQDFSTPASVNLLLGNLVKQLARKRIARRDAIALAYISQLLLNSLPPLERATAVERQAAKEAEMERFYALTRQQACERAARPNPQATNTAPDAPPGSRRAADPVVAGL